MVLVVLDGWGYRRGPRGQRDRAGPHPGLAPALGDVARAPCCDASGLAVGLPEGQMGNSEVGHLNLGAGRVVPQDLVRISQSIRAGEFFSCRRWWSSAPSCGRPGGTLHLVGLLGPGGVHAIDRHLLACVELGVRHGVPRIAIHGFLDGRDTPPTIGEQVVAQAAGRLRRIAPGRGGDRAR